MTAVPGGGIELGPVPLGATRRTTTILIAPQGDWVTGQTVTATGRDLSRSSDGDIRAIHDTFSFDIDSAGLIVPHSVGSSLPEELHGLPAQRGLRKAVAQLRMEMTGGGDYVFGPVDGLYDAMLDDIPGTSVASGYGRLYEGSLKHMDGDISSVMTLTCVGFSKMHEHGEQFNVQRYFETKPPSVEFVSGDVLAWHDDLPMPPNSFRRRRMLQVQPDAEGSVTVTGYFRDTFMRPDGVEMVVHEYGLDATVAGDPLVLVRAEAIPGNLPMEYCPLAAITSTKLEGLTIAEVEAAVRSQIQGPSGCTHLNDELRSLRYVPTLLEGVPA